MQPNVIFIDSILSSVYKSKLLKQVITPVIMQSYRFSWSKLEQKLWDYISYNLLVLKVYEKVW